MTLTNEEVIGLMYKGEQNRDASSKVRGFLFQDLVAIDELLKDETEYICTEYVEDVFCAKANKIVIIQAKYYPKTDVNQDANISAIMRDLYYHFLRLNVYGYSGDVIPQLSIYSKKDVNDVTLEQLKKYIGVDRDKKPDFKKNNIEDLYEEKKKKAQKKCFDNYAYDKSMERFLDRLNINTQYQRIGEYRKKLEDKINEEIKSTSTISDENSRKTIAMGLAIRFIQDSYNDVKNDNRTEFEKKKRTRQEFLEYLQRNTCLINEECIGAYLEGVAYDIWSEKEEDNPSLTQNQLELLHIIVGNTAKWISQLCNNIKGQKQLINTISRKKKEYVDEYENFDIEKRLTIIKEHRAELEDYLCFLWKILFDINQDLGEKEVNKKIKGILKIENYIDKNENTIIQLKFDSNVPTAVLLSGIGDSRQGEKMRNILSRMRVSKPELWYLCGKNKGCFSYDQDISEIMQGLNVASIAQETFKIECMNCIKVDLGEWNNIDDCNGTIFSEKCVED